MPVLKVRDPNTGAYVPLIGGGGPDEVTISTSQPSSPTDIWIDTDEVGGTTADFVLKSGDKMTGGLSLTTAELSGQIRLAKDQSGTPSAMRWQMYRYGAETGGNAGSDLIIANIADDGSYMYNMVWMERKTGIVTIPGLVHSGTAALVYQSPWGAQPSTNQQITYHAGMVTVDMSVKPSSDIAVQPGSSTLLGTVPVGYRPLANSNTACVINTATGVYYPGVAWVEPTGALKIRAFSAITVTAATGNININLTYRWSGS